VARPLRIEYPNAFYHVTSRGNERRAIYRTKGDYERFLGYLESATERYGAKIHCFCLMPNHYHLLLETPRANLRRIIHHLNTSYTNYFNVKTKRVGHLFQGRYRAILVEKDTYALELSRYIHLNPVRADLVKEPSQYPWSSYLAYVGGEKRWGWLERQFILGQMSSNEREARRRYQSFLREGMGKSFKDPLNKVVASTLLGSERFIEEVRQRFIKKASSDRDLPALRKLSSWPDLFSILKESERVFGKGTIASRRVALYLSHRLSGLSLEEIGQYFGGIGPSAVSQNTRRLRMMLEKDKEFLAEVQGLKKILSE
jgi:putative transposase